MKPRRIGDGILFIAFFGIMLILFYSLGSTAQSNVTEPVDIPKEVQSSNVSENGTQTLQLNNIGQGCVRGSVQAWDPSTNKYLEKPFNFTVEDYEACEVTLRDYYNSDISTHDVAFSYTYSPVDSVAVVSMAGFVGMLDFLTSGFGLMVLMIFFILLLPRIYRAIRVGGDG